MDTNQRSPENFSVTEGGPLHHALLRMKLDKQKWKLVLVFLCITWLPLVIITAVEGTLYTPGQNSFLADIAMQVRLLAGIPLLLLIGTGINNKVMEVRKYFSDTLMKDKEQQHVLNHILRWTRKLANSALAEIMLLVIIIAVTINFGKGGLFNRDLSGAGSWKTAVLEGNRVLSFAGNWANFISIPIFQFLMIRWLWKYIIWVLLLLRLSFTRLSLLATHPDKAGGLGVIILAQKYFCYIFVTINIVISGELTARLIRDPQAFAGIKSDGGSTILISLFLVLLPMFFFSRKLIDLKEEGLLKLSKLGTSLSHKFEEEWINDLPAEEKTTGAKITTSDLQDYDTIYVSLEDLRFVPFNLRNVIAIAILLFIPYIPILFIHFSIAELLQKILGLLA